LQTIEETINPSIHNVITTADTKQKVDAARFVNYSWGRYDLESYGGLCGYIKDEKIKGRVTVFLSGKMISTGARSIQESIHQLERAMELMVTSNFVRRILLSPTVQNIVATASLPSRIDLKAVATCIPKITYEPDQFAGAILRTKEGPVCLLFASGKIVIVGSTSEEQLLLTLRNLTIKLEDFLLKK
jgi:transcription initiation factor TFIID TATA-box-binding protein